MSEIKREELWILTILVHIKEGDWKLMWDTQGALR